MVTVEAAVVVTVVTGDGGGGGGGDGGGGGGGNSRRRQEALANHPNRASVNSQRGPEDEDRAVTGRGDASAAAGTSRPPYWER